MNISIICVGKLKEKYLKDACAEYQKRLKRFAKLEIIELKDERADAGMSKKEEDNIKKNEGERILSKVKQRDYVIALDVRGKEIGSEDFAHKIAQLNVNGVNSISFIIGGSLGLDSEVLKRADFKMSFSKMTFPHQLFRVMLLEQVYRVFKINSNETYHK